LLAKGEEIDPEAAPAGLRGGEIEEALEIMRTFTKSEAAKDLYRRRMDYLNTQKSIEYDMQVTARDKALVEGRAEGLSQGLSQGLAEGATERAHEDAIRLRALGVALEIIVQATGLTKEEVEGLKKGKPPLTRIPHNFKSMRSMYWMDRHLQDIRKIGLIPLSLLDSVLTCQKACSAPNASLDFVRLHRS
jgi:hypothetical protein